MDDERKTKIRYTHETHKIAKMGDKAKCGDGDMDDYPMIDYDCGPRGVQHIARSHEADRATKTSEPSLQDGLSMRQKLGDMKKAIEDGVCY